MFSGPGELIKGDYTNGGKIVINQIFRCLCYEIHCKSKFDNLLSDLSCVFCLDSLHSFDHGSFFSLLSVCSVSVPACFSDLTTDFSWLSHCSRNEVISLLDCCVTLVPMSVFTSVSSSLSDCSRNAVISSISQPSSILSESKWWKGPVQPP